MNHLNNSNHQNNPHYLNDINDVNNLIDENSTDQYTSKRSDAEGFGVAPLSLNQANDENIILNHGKEAAAKNLKEDLSEGQIIHLEESIHATNIEQQVDYALAQKNSFLQRHLKKIALIAVTICGGGVAVALANFKTKVTVEQTTTVEQIAVPESDKSKLINPSQAEKEQRNLIDQKQAQDALANGQSYSPEFTPQGLQASQLMPPAPIIPIEMPATQPAQLSAPATETEQTFSTPTPPVDALSESEVTKVRDGIYGQVDNLVKANNSQNGFNTVIYARKSNDSTAANFYNQIPEAQQGHVAVDAQSKSAKKKYRVIAGGMMYATLNQAINSDDGLGSVFATLHGGSFNGATLIGKIDEAPNNIRLTFSQITMHDGETLDISATAIREKDARAGMAEGIDNHTISRYSYLFISSFLKGLGQFARPPQFYDLKQQLYFSNSRTR